MIPFKIFKESIYAIKDQYEKDDKLLDALDCRCCVEPSEIATEQLFRLLTYVCKDVENDWIGYWMYELQYGAAWHEGSVKDKWNKPIKIETIEELYELVKAEYESQS